MHGIPSHEAPLVGILDIETGLDPIAMNLLGGIKSGLAGKAAMHRIRAATILTARDQVDGVEVGLRSWHIDALGEDELVATVDAELARLHDERGRLVTFNGRRHDLPILRRRLARHLRFDGGGVRRWVEAGAPHFDLMSDPQPSAAKWCSLQEEAAGLGIAMPTTPGSRDASSAPRQSEIDCATTYLVYLHLLAGVVGSGKPLLDGWRGLATAISRDPNLSHLRPLAKPAGLVAHL